MITSVLAVFEQHGVGNIVNSTVQYIKYDLLEAKHDHAKKFQVLYETTHHLMIALSFPLPPHWVAGNVRKCFSS